MAYKVVRQLSKHEKTMAGLHFDITADNSNFMDKIRETENGIKNASKVIDSLGRNFDMGSVESKVVSLNKVIKANENSILQLSTQLNKWQEDAQEAFNNNDMGAFNAITKDIEKQAAQIRQLVEETDSYKDALATVESNAGLASSMPGVQSTQFYSTQEDYEHAKALREEVSALKAEISGFDGDGAGLQALNGRLSEMQSELQECENKAADAAASLGEDLGGRAAEASERLYELNSAIESQQQAVDSLKESVKSAAGELESAKESGDAMQVEEAAAKYDALNASLQNAENSLRNMQAAQVDASSAMAAVSAEVSQADSVLVKLLGGQEKYNAIMSQMPPLVRDAASGITGMTGAAKAFIATPLGAVIAAIALALQTLNTWFNSTVEGQLKFAEISGYVSGVLGQLKEIAISVGKAIFNAFSDPKQAVSDLWEAIKKNFVNRIKALGGIAESVGKAIYAAFHFDWDGVKEGISQAYGQAAQLATGVENLAGKFQTWINGVGDAAKATAEIKRQLKELEIEVSKWEVQKEELEKTKAEAQAKMYNTNLSAQERKEALQAYKDAVNRQMEQEAAFADKRIELQEKRMSLTSNTIEDENELRKLQAERARVETDAARELASLQRRSNMIERGGTSSTGATSITGVATTPIGTSGKSEAEPTEDARKAELASMYEYLKEYGTYQEKRLAITEEYNRKIAEADTEWDKKALQNRMEEALSGLELDQLKQSINWELVFSDLDKASKSSLEKVKKQLKDFKESAEYKDMGVDQKKVIDKALNDIQTTLIDKGGLLGDLPGQLDELATAQQELAQAQNEYNEALERGTEAEKENAAQKVNNAQIKLQNAETNVQKSRDKAVSNLTQLAGTIGELGSSSEASLAQVGSLVNGIIGIVGEGGDKISGIIGTVFSLLDSIGEQGLDGFIGNILGSVAKAAEGSWSTIFGWTGIDFGGDSDETLAKDIERLTVANQSLEKAIDNLADIMGESAVADATDLYNQQKEYLEESIRNTQEMMSRSGAAYSNGFLGIGGSKSSNSKINSAMSSDDWSRISAIVGREISSAGDFWTLTSEEMYNVATNAADLYAKIKQYADDGYQDAAQYMDEYIQYYEELEELQEAYNEKLTSVSFDTVRDDFKSLLLDMESDTEDFADSFTEMMQEAVIESMISDTYAKRLEEWYENFASAMEDGALTSAEQAGLKEEWESMVDDAIAERNALMEAMGWDSSSSGSEQSASSKGFETMSQDTADELSGRFTALYEVGLQMLEKISVLQSIGVSVDESNSTLSEIRNLMVTSNGYLEDIAKYGKNISENFGEKLNEINNSLKNL